MHTIYRQPLVLSTELESIYESLEIFEATHDLLMQENHLSTGNHSIEFWQGMNDDLRDLESQPSDNDESSMEEVD